MKTRLFIPIVLLILFLCPRKAESQEIKEKHRARIQAWGNPEIELKVEEMIGHPEGFSITRTGRKIKISGGARAGLMYGAQEFERLLQAHASIPEEIEIFEIPDFELRGTVLFLMKDGSYDYKLTPEEFPWFYDRPLLTRYFDYLFENRFNTLFLWTGHLFSSIVEMPEYPDATDLSREKLLRNQAQFKWFTDECSKRNISVLLHFYQIHIPKALAKSRNIPHFYGKPNDFVRKYIRYSLDRFLSEFKDVGLYVCPGEALQSQYQPEWIRDVIFAAAKASGHDPRVVVRTWTLDKDLFSRVCKGAYGNFYTELKHNIEMIVSPVPDPNHREWKGIAKKHIVNVHEVADVKPFRWGSPLFIHEMVREWKAHGLDGAEVYGMASWRWPYSLDKLEPHQKPFWPTGKKLITFERDWIWLEAVGRYLWKVNREPWKEEKYWDRRLAARFGNTTAGFYLHQWYDVTGPILPGLQNLTAVQNMNWFPTAIGKEQMVDEILVARTGLEPGVTTPNFWGNRGYPSRPVDSHFFDLYKRRFDDLDLLQNRISMPVSVYAEKVAKSETIPDWMTPDKISDLFVAMARLSLYYSQEAKKYATANSKDEIERFITDSQALVCITQAWQHKVMAAISKRCWQLTGKEKYLEEMLLHMNSSVEIYEKLVELTDKTYINPTDIQARLTWHEGLKAFHADRSNQLRFVRFERLRRKPGVYWLDTEEMEGNWKVGRNYTGYFGNGFRVSEGPEQRGTVLHKRIQVKEAGEYAVWSYGLIGPGQASRSFSVTVNDQSFAPTHGDEGPPGGRFVWRRAGTVSLPEGDIEIVVKDADKGFECPDVVLLTGDRNWKPGD